MATKGMGVRVGTKTGKKKFSFTAARKAALEKARNAWQRMRTKSLVKKNKKTQKRTFDA